MRKSFLGGEKSAVIGRTREEVFDYLADMSRRHEWNGESLGQIRDTGYGQLQLKLA